MRTIQSILQDKQKPLEVVKVSTLEEAQHPERFNKVLESAEQGDSGLLTLYYRLERKELANSKRHEMNGSPPPGGGLSS